MLEIDDLFDPGGLYHPNNHLPESDGLVGVTEAEANLKLDAAMDKASNLPDNHLNTYQGAVVPEQNTLADAHPTLDLGKPNLEEVVYSSEKLGNMPSDSQDMPEINATVNFGNGKQHTNLQANVDLNAKLINGEEPIEQDGSGNTPVENKDLNFTDYFSSILNKLIKPK